MTGIKVPPPTRSKMAGDYVPPKPPPMREGADAHLTIQSRMGDVLSDYKPPVSMSAAPLEPATSYRAINLASKKSPKETTMSTKKPATTTAAPATTPAQATVTPPPGVVTVTKGEIKKRVRPGAYSDWLALRQVGDLLFVEPDAFESVKGRLSRYSINNDLNWRIVGQLAGADGMCKIGIESKDAK